VSAVAATVNRCVARAVYWPLGWEGIDFRVRRLRQHRSAATALPDRSAEYSPASDGHPGCRHLASAQGPDPKPVGEERGLFTHNSAEIIQPARRTAVQCIGASPVCWTAVSTPNRPLAGVKPVILGEALHAVQAEVSRLSRRSPASRSSSARREIRALRNVVR